MDKHCFVIPSNLTVSFVKEPLIHLHVGDFKNYVINLFNILYKLHFIKFDS